MHIKPTLAALMIALMMAANGTQENAPLRLDPDKITGKIEVGIYGQFLEHIYNSVQGGLWGQMILNGSLEVYDAKTPLKYWELIGQPVVLTDNPMNGASCVRLEQSCAGEVGLRQSPLRFDAGMRYQGSLYLRGSGTVEVAILGDGGQALGSKTFNNPGDTWKKQDFEFTSARAATTGEFRIVLKGVGKMDVDLVQLFSQAALELGGLRPDLYEAVKGLQPASLRWPGGCFASRYDWKNGLGPREQRKPNGSRMWRDQDYGEFGINEFAALCRRLDTEPVLVVNFGLRLQNALDLLEYALGDKDTRWGAERIKNGIDKPLPLRRIELDNETWGMGVPAYAAKVKEYSSAIRAKYPQLRLIACGSNNYKQEWNRELIAACAKDFDFISVHHYSSSAGNYQVEDAAKYEAFLQELIGIIQQSENPNLKIYVSEWNPNFAHNWRCGLYTAALLNAFERHGDYVEMACPALFLRRTWHGSTWNNALINHDQQGWFPAQNYVVEKMYREHYGPQKIAVEGGAGMNFLASRSADGKKVFFKAVNPDASPRQVELELTEKFHPSKAVLRQVVAPQFDTHNTMENRDTVRQSDGQVTLHGQKVLFTMPPLSVVALTIE